MALVHPNPNQPSAKSVATVALSTNADGFTGADVVDVTGMALAGIELSSVCTDANYSIKAAIGSTILKTLLTSTGGVVSFGTTAAGNTSGRVMAFDPAPYVGLRYLQLMSGTTTAAIANATGATATLMFSVYGSVK